MTRQQKRRRLADWISELFGSYRTTTKLARATVRVIRAEPLEKRELMAGDLLGPWLGSVRYADDTSNLLTAPLVSTGVPGSSRLVAEGESRLTGEGEAQDDLVAFAKALAATTTKFYGADWCRFCTEQKQLFQDGAKYLPFVEVTNADHTVNSIGLQNNITSYPTWVFPDGSRLEGVQTLATIAQRSGVAIPKSEQPYLSAISNVNVGDKSPLHIPLDGYSPNGRAITYSVISSNPNVISAETTSSSNRSIRIATQSSTTNYGEMVFQLFEDKAPRPAGRVIQLAEQNFYDGLTFHRITTAAAQGLGVIQGGDPNGTGTGGSSLGNFDDQFSLDLLHNRSGVLSFAKSSDDTNNSQFFITDAALPFLDHQHSIFGQLVEGNDARTAIQRVPTNSQQRPNFAVVMSDVSVFDDTENGMIVLKNVAASGSSTITVTATDDLGQTFTRSFVATVVADNGNRAPFLNDIPALQATAGQTFNFTLTSQDREGDAPIYSVTKVTSGDYTLSVNAQTGVVTLVPPTGFTGPLQFRASVSQSAQTVTNDATDSQLVTVNVSSGSGLTLSLNAASDTGKSNSDRITSATSLVFTVAGTTSGGTVDILNGNTVVGTATASGSSTQVTVNAINLSNTIAFTARQTLNSQTSTTATPLSVTIDRTAPVAIPLSSIPVSAVVGTNVNLNLNHPNEGTGLTYTISNQPAGMTIDASSGIISWTPQVSQLGAQSFGLSLTDDAGNATQQTVSLNVIQDPNLRMSLAVVSADGNPLTSVQIGQTFKVQLILKDLRSGAAARGVFSAYADLLFDPAVIRPIQNSPITYVSPYLGGTRGTVEEGIINEVGALAGTQSLGSEERVLVEVTFTAIASGNSGLRLEPNEDPNNETTLYNDPVGALPVSKIQYDSASITVASNFQAANDLFNFDEDAPQQTLNVLTNDGAASGVVLTITNVSNPSRNGTVTIASDGRSLLYTPAANVNGAETFTYTVANAQGSQQTATVTIQLTDINDPPVATADSLTVTENSSNNTLDVLANDTKGVDTTAVETLTVTQVSAGSANGTLQVGTGGLNVRYTPRPGFTGTETFTYTLSDGRGGTAVGTVSVLVSPAVPPPTVNNESFTIIEDANQASFDVLANDVPTSSSHTLTIAEVRPSERGSTVSISSDGTRLLYKPALNLAGQEVITYIVRASDGGTARGNVTFNITNVNDAPVAVADNFNITSATGTSTLNVLSNDTDPDVGDVLTITNISQPPSGSGTLTIASDGKSISYAPPSNTFEGNFSFNYTIRDAAGLTSSSTASVTVRNFVPRSIGGKVLAGTSGLRQVQLTLTGKDSSGADISRTTTSAADGSYSFGNLPPGNYMLKRAALPFFNDQGQEIAIQSAESDGNNTTNLNVTGSLRTQHVDIRDFLGSSRRNRLSAIINQSGAVQWISPQGDWASLNNISLTMGSSNLTVTAANATATNLTANIPLTSSALSTAANGEFQLVRLRGATTRFRLAPPETNGNGTNTNGNNTIVNGNSLLGEGESSVSPIQNAATQFSNTRSAEGESSASPLSFSSGNGNSTGQPSHPGQSGQYDNGYLVPNQVLQMMLGSQRRRIATSTNSIPPESSTGNSPASEQAKIDASIVSQLADLSGNSNQT